MDELKPFNISVISIEPGSFRTNVLSRESLTLPKNRIADYDGTPARQVMEMMQAQHGMQPGDIAKGCQAIIDTLAESGNAEGKKFPTRLVLGPDGYGIVKDKCEGTLKLLDEWKDISTQTNHEVSLAGVILKLQ